MTGITIGCVGSPWRASVGRGGTITPWDSTAPLRWSIAADDRWYIPGEESNARQGTVDGTPVVETTIRVPRGEIVQRVYATMHAGGVTAIEISNKSTLPVVVAFSRGDLLAARTPANVPIQGIELPAGSVTFPVGHRTNITVALSHNHPAAGPLPPGLPDSDQVVRGWLTTCAQASSMDLPDESLNHAVVRARCSAALEAIADPDQEPADFLVTLSEIIRLGEPADPWLADVVVAAERVLRRGTGTWEERTAITAAERIFAAAGEDRALADVRRAAQRWSAVPERPDSAPTGAWIVPWTEQLLVDADGSLFPTGLPRPWAGINFEAHGLPVDGGRVSFAVRWHGARPALLWETEGDVTLRSPRLAPQWSTTESEGETLWPEFSR